MVFTVIWKLQIWLSVPPNLTQNTSAVCRGSVRSTRGLGPTMTARGQSIGIYWYATANTDFVDYGTKDIQVLHYGIWLWRRILNGACISISNLPENIAWQTHWPEARGPLKSGAWGGRPTCHPQTPPPGCHYSYVRHLNFVASRRSVLCVNCAFPSIQRYSNEGLCIYWLLRGVVLRVVTRDQMWPWLLNSCDGLGQNNL